MAHNKTVKYTPAAKTAACAGRATLLREPIAGALCGFALLFTMTEKV